MGKTLLLQACREFIENAPESLYYITPTELNEILNNTPQNVFILDVRNLESFEESHIEGAVHIDMDELFQNINLAKIPLDKTIVVCCGIGHIASQILTLLQLLGYDAIGLKYGMGVSTVAREIQKGWEELGYPVQSANRKN